jgi:serine/threonine protein kinase/formylglycine-generating enzyme required for sulfatase activity/dienelactone hydrolase
MSLAPGAKLGPYEIVAPLGAGGMGVVYRAHDQRLERDVAVKVLPHGLLAEDAARKRFRKEALALARLSHPNIAAVYDFGEQDGADYLVMEYVPGQSLADKIRSGPLSTREAVALGAQIAAALEEAHGQGVVHRDLKPANVIITPKGHAKVLDFGLAKLLATEDVTASFSETKGPMGTPLYMSPEQAEGKVVDARTDLWSLGIVLYESLSGRVPFQGTGSLAVLRAVTHDPVKPLRDLRADVPEDANHIISRALEKDVARRYQSAAEMSGELSAALARLSAPPLPAVEKGLKLRPSYAISAVVLLAIIAVSGFWLYRRSERRNWAREAALPEISELHSKHQDLAAYLLLEKAEKYLPGDPQVAQIAAQNTRTISITSSPSDATVEIQDYEPASGAWHSLGATPLNKIRIPNGYFRWKVSHAGMNDYVAAPFTEETMNVSLETAQQSPAGMVPVSGEWAEFIGFIGWQGPYKLPLYYMDRFEVTNAEYQKFVDSGGYEKREYWADKFMKDEHELNWDHALPLFRDSTGRAGPSTWRGGHYGEGEANLPVSGVSWYEASAYATFAGKSLPVLSQWFQAAPPGAAAYIIPSSNISRSGLAPVGSFKGLGPFGTYDMAGNVKEWIANASDDGLHLILGGAWNSQTYIYSNPDALSPFDRSAENGFRCVKNPTPLPVAATDPIRPFHRDFLTFKPASDAVFHAYEAMYDYDKSPLNVKSEGVVEETADWRKEKITFDAAYGGERVTAYLFLPKNVHPPYQTVLFFPSARVLFIPNSNTLGDLPYFDYIIQSGRAVMYPVYQGTYERQIKFSLPTASQSIALTTQRYKDTARSLDYLETRPDIDKDKFAFLGVSMGSAEGVIYTTLLQDRLKTVVFLDGGYFLDPPPPGGDQADFAPRLKKPTLMVNGRYDFSFPLEKAQLPLFRTIGTPDTDKSHVILESPHDVNAKRPEMVKAVLEWMDKYLGRVQ